MNGLCVVLLVLELCGVAAAAQKNGAAALVYGMMAGISTGLAWAGVVFSSAVTLLLVDITRSLRVLRGAKSGTAPPERQPVARPAPMPLPPTNPPIR